MDELNRDGICILRGVLDTDKIEGWGRAFDCLFEVRKSREADLQKRLRCNVIDRLMEDQDETYIEFKY